MIPYFNTSGPCVAGEHYMLPPGRRLGRVMELVEQGRYFALHAGRQTGKTTCARWLVRHLRAAGRFSAMWVDIQTAREEPDPARATREILSELVRSLKRDVPGVAPPSDDETQRWLQAPGSAVLEWLQHVCAGSDRPLVVLVDEADGLVGASMVSFLTQLRRGYVDRSAVPFPHALALLGMRQVRDYVLSAEDRRAVSWLGTTSPFNITAEAQTLALFSAGEVAELLAQHTETTGQRFEPEAAARIYELSAGHPWLVNALADQMVRDVRERTEPLCAAHVDAARETLIVERRTHIDSLVARLREPRVRRIVGPMLAGGPLPFDDIEDDLLYVQGLGLIARQNGQYRVANPIYREVIPRALTFPAQASIYQETAWYLDAAGRLDMGRLLRGFQAFWREDGHLAAEGFRYREAGPHLMLMAFLQRVVNSGGRIHREYGLGRGRLDLLIRWQDQRLVVEVKVRRHERTEAMGADQLVGHLDGLGLGEGWLVLFDQRQEISWDDKLFERDLEHDGKRLHIFGC